MHVNGWYDRTILAVFVIGFASGTVNHVADVWRGGMLPYARWYEVPELFNWYWTSLTLLDPLAIIALCVNVRVGYVAGLSIMLTDVPINFYANAHHWKLPIFENQALLWQSGFLIFLLLTFLRIWEASRPVKKRDRV